MSKTAYMRGLQVFISDIRACQNKEQEQRRVEKELAKIRAKFGEDKALSGYDRRKYIWKLLYIYMLGFDIDFGHKQACDLIPMQKYSDKQVGYMACSLLLQENDEFLRLAINAIHLDMTSRNEAFQALALSFVGNIGGQEMAEALTLDVLKLLTSGATRPLIKKRASLCLLRLLRKTPADGPLLVSADTFSPTMGALLEERDLGLLLCSVTLLHGLISRSGTAGYETCQGRVIKILERLVRERDRIPPEYLYYGIPSPWLQARCLRALQLYPPPDSVSERKALHDVLQNIIAATSAEAAKNANPNKTNALNAILFEALALALHHASATNNAISAGPDAANDRATLSSCLALMGRYLGGKDPNAKYLALDSLARLAGAMPEVLEGVRAQQGTVMASLKDPDVSIRRRALDLLFAMCDAAIAPEVVGELLKHLVVADFGVREELVLKIAILAEKFAPSMQWYMDVVLQLLERSGDFVSDEIWHRAVQLVTNNPSMQEYAARNVAEALKRGAAQESMICTAAYILGEYGRLIRNEVPPGEQYRLLAAAFPAASQPAKGLLMTALLKIYLLDPSNAGMARDIRELFERYKRFMDAELQQRATEYLQALAANPQAAAAQFVLPMPAWTIRESSLIKRLQGEGADGAGDAGSAGAGASGGDAPSTLAGANPSPLLSVPMPGPAPHASSAAPDLLSMDSNRSGAFGAGGVFGAPPSNGGAAAAAAAPAAPPPPAKPATPVDLLSDLFSDVVVSSSSSAAAAPPAPAPVPAAAPGLPPYPGAVPPAAVPSYPGYPTGPAYPGAPTGFPPGAPSPYGAVPPPPVAGGFPPYGAPAPVAAVPPPAPAPPASNPFASNPFAAPSAAAAIPAAAIPPPPPVPAAVAPPAPVAHAPAAAHADPFGDSSFGAPAPAFGAAAFAAPPAAAAAPAPVDPPRPTGDLEAWFNALLLKERGILYEDQYLQIGLQSQYGRGSGNISLFLGNKNAAARLTTVSITLAAPAPGLQVTVGPLPPQLEPKQQVQVPISLVCLGPFTAPPALALSYGVGGAPALPPPGFALRLPVAMHKFMLPEPRIPKELFFEHWRAAQPHCKAQEMVDRAATGPLSPEAVQGLMRLLHLGVEHGYLDPSPHNEAGAAYWGAGPVPEQQRPVLCCCRVEGNPQNRAQFRVTVVAEQPELAQQVHALLVAQVKAAPASS